MANVGKMDDTPAGRAAARYKSAKTNMEDAMEQLLESAKLTEMLTPPAGSVMLSIQKAYLGLKAATAEFEKETTDPFKAA